MQLLSYLSLAFTFLGLGLWGLLGLEHSGALHPVLPDFLPGVLGAFAYFMAYGAAMKVTDRLSVVALYAAMGLLVAWLAMLQFPLAGAALAVLLATVGLMVRFHWFGALGHSRLRWLEPGVLLLALGVYVAANLLSPAGWQVWALPVPAFIALAGMAMSNILEMGKVAQHAQLGYRVKVGEPAPDFSLTDEHGQTVRLSDFRGRTHVLLVFVRGDWCPFCHIMLRTYQQDVAKFAAKGVTVLAIGPDPEGVNRAMVQKLGLRYQVLSDQFFLAAGLYGIHAKAFTPMGQNKMESEGSALPAAFLVDKGGVLRYHSQPDLVGQYLDPRTIFPVLEKLRD
jgi:peroxiredoxin